ncbi:hypothetical protein ACQEWB_45450 [Streptomyces sp. CA-249302]
MLLSPPISRCRSRWARRCSSVAASANSHGQWSKCRTDGCCW